MEQKAFGCLNLLNDEGSILGTYAKGFQYFIVDHIQHFGNCDFQSNDSVCIHFWRIAIK